MVCTWDRHLYHKDVVAFCGQLRGIAIMNDVELLGVLRGQTGGS